MQDSRLQSVIIFDGDDTLWRTMPLYAHAKQRFFALVSKLAPAVSKIDEEFEQRDRNNVARWGFTIERFRNSMIETYRECMRRAGAEPELKREDQISRIASSVIHRRAIPMGYARPTLERLSGSFRLVLLTKGEYELQKRRIVESGFENFFERITIVEHKDARTFRQLLAELNTPPHVVWSVGDSLRSDVLPALAAGLQAVWVPQKTWSYEDLPISEPTQRFRQAKSLRQLAGILAEEQKREGV